MCRLTFVLPWTMGCRSDTHEAIAGGISVTPRYDKSSTIGRLTGRVAIWTEIEIEPDNCERNKIRRVVSTFPSVSHVRLPHQKHTEGMTLLSSFLWSLELLHS